MPVFRKISFRTWGVFFAVQKRRMSILIIDILLYITISIGLYPFCIFCFPGVLLSYFGGPYLTFFHIFLLFLRNVSFFLSCLCLYNNTVFLICQYFFLIFILFFYYSLYFMFLSYIIMFFMLLSVFDRIVLTIAFFL